ncbi:MAG: BolA family transcriptional regulator [Betaproteobacteria bacterium]|nr:BolA family transcriptional regulator [Betaproteobacteria bacterium]MEA3155764.1 BolA family transcriptional regulator, ral stress-responsive regulator [Betaproteobacteria bacterium]
MSVTELIRERLASLSPESVDIEDESARHAGHAGAQSGGGHYALTLVSAQFAGQPLQARHRMVYTALGSLMHKEIHALAIRAYAPGEI